MGSSFLADFVDGTGESRLNGTLLYGGTVPASPAALNAVSPAGTVTSGTIPHITLSSGTELQALTTRDVDTYTIFTSDASNNAATCTVAISPDDTTFTTVLALSVAAAINNLGAITLPIAVRVPAAWWLKMTFAHGTVSTTVYA